MADIADSATEQNVRYEDSKLYELVNDVNGDNYVGSTVMELAPRWRQHKFLSKDSTRTSKLYACMREIGVDHFHIRLIESYPCKSKEELLAREDHFIKTLKPTLNTVGAIFDEEKHKAWVAAYRSTDAYRTKKAASDAAYAKRNKAEIAAYKKKWNAENSARISARKRALYAAKKAAAAAEL